MNKVHHLEDHEDIYQMMGGQMWSLYDDRYNIKSAASDVFTKEALRAYAPDKDHFMIHLVGMGDYEHFGPNKNADAFRMAGLQKRAHTFVTDGCFFREHRNRSQEKEGIGNIKAAAFHPDMHRVELIVWGHRKKAAEEYELARAGEPLSFSMSCRVPFDECNACGNKARTPKEYCGHMKTARLQYVPEFQKYAFVHNDHPTFFDMSRVRKPADRIAHYLDYAFPDEDMRKAAAEHAAVILGHEWAEYEGVCIPEERIELSGAKYEMLTKLAAEEAYLDDDMPIYETSAKSAFADNIVPLAFEGELDDAELDAFRKIQPGTLFHQLSKRACLLPFFSFAAYVTDKTVKEAQEDPTLRAAAVRLPKVFRTIKDAGCCCGLGGIEQLFNSTGHNTQQLDQGMDDEVQRFMDKVAQRFSIGTEPTQRRVMHIVISKSASKKELVTPANLGDNSLADSEKAEAISNLYAIYKIAALVDMKDMHGVNIDEAQLLLTAGQNRVF
jgi:hypothetical protein